MAGRSHVMRDGEIREPSIYLSIFFSSFFFPPLSRRKNFEFRVFRPWRRPEYRFIPSN